MLRKKENGVAASPTRASPSGLLPPFNRDPNIGTANRLLTMFLYRPLPSTAIENRESVLPLQEQASLAAPRHRC